MHASTIRRISVLAIIALGVTLILLASQRNTPGSLLPHGYCFTWNPLLLWMHVTGDSLIGMAYISIPLTLLHLVRKRSDMPFNWIVLLFATFIVSCGATHWIEVWTVWNPDYWLSGAVKLVTATASVLTAIALVYLVPRLLAIPTAMQMRTTTLALEEEVRRRQRIEEELRAERAALELRVESRTQELWTASARAQSAYAIAEEANRQKDNFLAKVSHELRTPLQSTLTWAQALTISIDDRKSAMLAAQRIIHNVRVQARLIDDLLDISRAMRGKLQLAWQRADALQVVQRAVDIVRDTARARGVEIDWSAQGAAIPIVTDPARLEQVVWNLLSNAVHASSTGQRVRVCAELRDADLHIAVQDEGAGIAAADLLHIFEPFRQGPDDENRHQGLGLGLAIVQNIVALFGGRIRAHSDGPGKGARFEVVLPLAMADGDADVPHPTTTATLDATEMARLRGLRVLYVEDEPELGEGGELVLASLGVNVHLCQTFEAASDRIRQGDFDVLLSDLKLDAGHSGLELMPLLRASPGGAAIPALIVSAFGSQAHRDASLHAGFAAHLVKPTDGVDMARALLQAIGPRAGA